MAAIRGFSVGGSRCEGDSCGTAQGDIEGDTLVKLEARRERGSEERAP